MRARFARRDVVLGLVVAAFAIGGVAWSTTREEGAATLDDYCGPPAVVSELPAVSAEADEMVVAFEPVSDVEGAVAAAEVSHDELLVVAKSGELYRVVDGGAAEEVIDLSAEVATDSLEQGMLGVAVAPDGAHVYLYATLIDGTDTILEFALAGGMPDVGTRRTVLALDDPAPTHNGGRIAFGPDGRLWLGIGDGGDGALTNAAQDLASPFGKLLRIDPTPDGDAAYTIPPDNPFVGIEGHRGEVWAYGLRNPWGWSLDRETGDLWVGDVGQLCFEEIDRAPAGGRGANFGWSHTEGAHAFDGPALGEGGAPAPDVELPDLGARPDDLVGPVLEYRHASDACSVIGGYVYRGAALPDLDGAYLYADLCRRAIFTLRPDGDRWVRGELGGAIPPGIVSFSEGLDGEIYAISLSDGIFKITPA